MRQRRNKTHTLYLLGVGESSSEWRCHDNTHTAQDDPTLQERQGVFLILLRVTKLCTVVIF